MKKQILMGATVVQLISYLFLPVTAAAAARDDWQEQRLLAPSGPQLSTEQRGRVVIYDEHYWGRNIDVGRLPDGTEAICGKPPYRADWAGGRGRR